MSVDQIGSRLDDRFALLTGGPRTADPRQRTLKAAMDWSYDLLDDDERALLRKVSVFAGSFSLDSAEELLDGERVAVWSDPTYMRRPLTPSKL